MLVALKLTTVWLFAAVTSGFDEAICALLTLLIWHHETLTPASSIHVVTNAILFRTLNLQYYWELPRS